MKQPDDNSNQVTPGVENSTNFKEYFLKYDGIHNLNQELVFSVFQRYMCKAGCKVCYLQDQWMSDDKFQAFVPKEIDPATEARILEFFEHFAVVSMCDDLNYIKKNYPHLYQFYVRNSHRMHASSMTDTAFIQQHKLLLDELNFQTVYEISFSDLFLYKKKGTMVNDLIEQLAQVHAKSPIRKIKIIICSKGGEKSEPVKKMVEFAHSLGIYVGVHDNILQGDNLRLDLEDVDYQELNYYSQGSEPLQVLSEVVYMMYTGVAFTLSQAVLPDVAPFHDIMRDGIEDVDHFIRNTLQAKLDLYARYVRTMENRCNNKHFDYFSYVSSSVTVNKYFNFIPKFVLQPWTEMYKKLRAQGWVETQYGLYDTSCTQGKVIPLFDISDSPKHKIYHIPIKSVPIVRRPAQNEPT